jgi:hypothetical protein
MTEREILEQVEEMNRLLDEIDQREVWIGEPQPIEVTDEYVEYVVNFIRENELYDDIPLIPLTP